MAHRSLSIYLNDHLAGSTTGRELARRALRNNRGSDLEPVLGRLVTEIEEDRDALRRLMDDLGVRPNHAKIALAWLLEKAGRLKPNGRLVGYSPLSRLVELEALTIGIFGKRALWAALERANARASAADFTALRERAERQGRELEQQRVEAAAAAFGRGTSQEAPPTSESRGPDPQNAEG